MPALAPTNPPGFALAALTRSSSVLYLAGFATSTVGTVPSIATGCSPAGSSVPGLRIGAMVNADV